jgi:Integrase core domain
VFTGKCYRKFLEVACSFWSLNFQAIKKMGEDNLVEGLPHIDQVEQVCDGCLVGKQRRSSFPHKSQYRAGEALELVHGDLCGPILPCTPSGNKYFFLLVDDHTRFMWVILLKQKDQVFTTFKGIKACVEVEQNRKLKCFRSDRGGEFKSCKNLGIKRQMTAPYSPQQNGVVERRNQTDVVMARSMMKSMRVPSGVYSSVHPKPCIH